jgi:cytochrome o ubiquinol oxidase subunit 2
VSKKKILFGCLLFIAIVVLLGLYLSSHNIQVLNAKGTIAKRERSLLIVTFLLSLLVVIPVFTMTFVISWKYRASNTHAKYTPDWDHHLGAEVAWWAIPSVIILVLSVITWNSSHSLDPYKPLASKSGKSLNVQVVALNWKWLFIYPQQHIASVNMLEFPVNEPLNLELTADAPMNSFWIPQLGGQIYAMPGMVTQLHLVADQSGDYRGSSANISGAGFAGMDFTARATSQTNFSQWAKSSSTSSRQLTADSYKNLSKDSQYNPVAYYSVMDNYVFDQVVGKYMSPNGSAVSSMSSMESMQ